ncbi:MAG: peptide-methionine (S)-S-oxide reductase MsrA [Bacteroidales bacterium]|nr:peptide-methionine (S)-S-oxide reductase MsrA [Bacteroidales bacterium]
MDKKIYLAGGCFWGVEHFFGGVDGVLSAISGYANGNIAAPSYEQVYTDKTGFAETVEVTYDPSRISLRELLELYFCIIDPLSVNKQGHDEGTRYRTGIYWCDEEDAQAVGQVFEGQQRKAGKPLAVETGPLRNFYKAEEYHQEYLDKNPAGYCHLPLKTFRYLRAYQDLANLLEGEDDMVAKMAETSSVIHARMRFFWTGFYIVRGDVLVLGPFQGTPACLRIGYGKGVCGTAWKEDRTVIVPDVEEFPGHIACSSESRSEIVLPLRKDGKVTAVLDIDSDSPATFDSTDALWLEKMLSLL